MARRNITGVLSGIIGEPQIPEGDKREAEAAPGIVPKEENTSASSPVEKKVKREFAQNEETRGCFILSKQVLKKIKYVAAVDGISQKQILHEALTAYLEKWEAENHKIKFTKR